MSEYEFIPAAAPNFMRGRGGSSIDMVVLHTTVGTMPATLATFQNPGRIASAHYVVGLDGRIVQMVFEWNTAFHAGNFSVNERSVGIEHVDNGAYNGPRTPALYAASIQLVAEICHRNGIPIDRAHIRKHKEVSDNPTACPDALDVDRIVNGAANFKYTAGEQSLEGDNDLTPLEHDALMDIRGSTAIRNPVTSDAVRTIVAQALAGFTVTAPPVNLAPVLDALKALQDHGDPVVRDSISKIEAHLNAPRPPA